MALEGAFEKEIMAGALYEEGMHYYAEQIGDEAARVSLPHYLTGLYESHFVAEGGSVGNMAPAAWILEYGSIYMAPLAFMRTAVSNLGLHFEEEHDE